MQTVDYMEQIRPRQEYIEALEEELRKIQVFHRELPLSLQIVTQVIDNYRRLAIEPLFLGRSDCEEISSDGPVLEEFIPLKRDEEKSKERSENSTKKHDWLKSVQLWNQELNPLAKEELPLKPSVGTKKSGGAFHPFHREKDTPVAATPKLVPVAEASSTADSGGGLQREEKEGQSNRKARRCWSPELHRRFLHALQQLGGSSAATPKQVRELMKVDGLTNDEVKSHLQKYRLHTRGATPAIQKSSSSSTPQPPQFVVVGGMWVPPPEYAVAAAAAAMAPQPAPAEAASAATNEIYAPVATLPQRPVSHHQQQKNGTSGPFHYRRRGSQEEEQSIGNHDINSNSPATSSSSHATTTSPAY